MEPEGQAGMGPGREEPAEPGCSRPVPGRGSRQEEIISPGGQAQLSIREIDKGVLVSRLNSGDLGPIPEAGKIPCRREWLPTPVFLPGKFHGQKSLAGYSP